ncbi:hypothetical protein ACJ5NV_16250 [Loktanella agnita]
MRGITSCDFVTRIPVCPSNGLPMYREFNDEEVETLAAFIQTPEFAAIKQKPPYQRAYDVAHHLGDTMSPVGFSLSLSAWWYETDAFVANPRIQDSFLREAEAELGRSDADGAPVLAALTAFAAAHAGRDDYARRWLAEGRSRLGDNPQGIAYLEAVAACLADISAAGCAPDDRFEP